MRIDPVKAVDDLNERMGDAPEEVQNVGFGLIVLLAFFIVVVTGATCLWWLATANFPLWLVGLVGWTLICLLVGLAFGLQRK